MRQIMKRSNYTGRKLWRFAVESFQYLAESHLHVYGIELHKAKERTTRIGQFPELTQGAGKFNFSPATMERPHGASSRTQTAPLSSEEKRTPDEWVSTRVIDLIR